MSVSPRARTLLALLLISAAGLAVRAWGIDLPGLSSDEAFSWRIVQYPGAEMVRRLAGDVHTPLYFLLLQAWVGRCGDSLQAMRGLSTGLGLLAVLAAFAVAREAQLWIAPHQARPARAGLLAALLLAIQAGQVAAGRNVRMYTLPARRPRRKDRSCRDPVHPPRRPAARLESAVEGLVPGPLRKRAGAGTRSRTNST